MKKLLPFSIFVIITISLYYSYQYITPSKIYEGVGTISLSNNTYVKIDDLDSEIIIVNTNKYYNNQKVKVEYYKKYNKYYILNITELNNIEDVLTKISDYNYLVKTKTIKIPKIENNFNNKNLNDYVKDFSTIIDLIWNIDDNFNVEDYKIDYKIVDLNKGLGFINLTYFIDNVMTNKVYTIDFDNYEAKSIMLVGITNDNVDNINLLDKNKIKNKIINFESNKENILKENLSDIFKDNETITNNRIINKDSFINNVIEYEEKYYYDYNTQTLKYIIDITIEKTGINYAVSKEIVFD